MCGWRFERLPFVGAEEWVVRDHTSRQSGRCACLIKAIQDILTKLKVFNIQRINLCYDSAVRVLQENVTNQWRSFTGSWEHWRFQWMDKLQSCVRLLKCSVSRSITRSAQLTRKWRRSLFWSQRLNSFPGSVGMGVCLLGLSNKSEELVIWYVLYTRNPTPWHLQNFKLHRYAV